MSSGFVRAGANANRGGEAPFTIQGKSRHPIYEAMRILRSLWPTKTAAETAARAQNDERTCKHWLAGAYEPSGRAMVNLLRSDAGAQILNAIMCDPVPDWYARQKLLLDLMEAGRRAEQAKEDSKLLKRALSDRS